MSVLVRLSRHRISSLKGQITLSFFVAMLILLVIMVGVQINSARSSRQKLQESLTEDLQATWRTALDSNGVSASRQVPTLMSLARTGLQRNSENSLISDETRALYHRIDIMAPDGSIRHSSSRPLPTAPIAAPEFIVTRMRYDSEFSSLVMADIAGISQPAVVVALRPARDTYLLALRRLSAMAPLLNDGIDGHWMVRDQQGQVLAADLPPDIADAILAQPPSQRGVDDLSINDRLFQLVALPLNDLHAHRIATLTSIRDVTDARRRERYELFFTLSLGLGLIFLTTFLLHERLDAQFRPLRELSNIVTQVAEGHLYDATSVPASTSELRQMANAISVLQANAIESDHQQFNARLVHAANLELIETEMNRLRQTLGNDAQRMLEQQMANEPDDAGRLGRAFRIMVDQVISQHSRLTDLLGERERDLTVVRQALAERQQLVRLREELDIARQLQISNLPGEEAMRALGDQVDLYATMRPAQEVGGDFYDFALLDGRYLVLLIGDASGKGVSAAMFGMMARILLKAAASERADPGDCLALANRALAAENNALLFATAFLGVLDLSSGQLRYASAGHNPPLIRRSAGGLEAMDQECGLVLGAMDDSSYPTHEGRLAPGDMLLLYTDGVTEAHDARNQLYGEARLSACLAQVPASSARNMTEDLLDEIGRFTGDSPQFDDITVTALRYLRAGPAVPTGDHSPLQGAG